VRPEVELLITASRRDMTAGRVERSRRLVADNLDTMDWTYLLDQAQRHRVTATLGRNLAIARLFSPEEVTVRPREAYRASYLYHRNRNRALYDELAELFALFDEHGIPVAIRKGGFLAEAVYGDVGIRPMSDLDLLISRADAEPAVAALSRFGYSAGHLGRDGRTVEPEPRRAQLFLRMHGNTLPIMVRPTSDPYVDAFVVDLCVDLFLPKSGCSVPADELLARAETTTLGGRGATVLAPEDMVMDLAAHLYKESTTLRYLKAGKHQRLRQYWDILEFIAWAGSRFDWDVFLQRTSRHGVATPMYFALAHADLLDPGAVPAEALVELLRLCGSDPKVLDEYAGIDLERPLTWSEDFLTRMFSTQRKLDLPTSRSVV
jgi:Uncharacterised nucleotidyltransferase